MNNKKVMKPVGMECEWDPQGNGHYRTQCGYLVYDYARLLKALGNKKQSYKIADKCKKCGKKVVVG